MNIKEQIGLRIAQARKEKKYTQTELAQKIGQFSQPCLNNWEKGVRSPSIEDLKTLAEVLEVHPAYLMCLTNRKGTHPYDKDHVGAIIPVLDVHQACHPHKIIDALASEDYDENIKFIPISYEQAGKLSSYAFVFTLQDTSMEPELLSGDKLIIDAAIEPQPGDIVLAKIEQKNKIVVRKYKEHPYETGASNYQFELVSLNEDWPNIMINSEHPGEVIGVVCSYIRSLK